MTKEPILTIKVNCLEAAAVKGHTMDIVMVPFTGTAEGPYFTGTVSGTGMDTQKIEKNGRCRLSARYILEGKDADGLPCKLFIENESGADGKLRPKIVTDSEVLAAWETSPLYAELEPAEGGVVIRIFKERGDGSNPSPPYEQPAYM